MNGKAHNVLVFTLVYCLCTVVLQVDWAMSVQVSIPHVGEVVGITDTTDWTMKSIFKFMGIPYAQSPIGPLRFKPPVPRAPWSHVLNATTYGRRCPVLTTVATLSPADLNSDLEDCLTLSIYTKSLTGRYPVMFYVHGGGFYNGSAIDHPPNFLLEEDIVLVVAQYRLGALGFLTNHTPQMPGNVPVMDLQLALQWVQKHIHIFGGNRHNVTIFGQSAGAALVGALILSPCTPAQAFHRAIMQSGSIFSSWGINASPSTQVETICKALSCENCFTDAGVDECLRKATVLEILQVTSTESFSPVVCDLNGVLPAYPDALVTAVTPDLSIMAGFTKDDGSFVLATQYDSLKNKGVNFNNITVREFAEYLMTSANDHTGLANNLLFSTMFSPELLNSYDHKSALPAYFDLCSTVAMKSGVITLVSQLLGNGLSDIYLYSFDYAGEHTRFGYEFGNAHYPFNGGIHHSNDNLYLFPTYALNEEDTEMAKTMVKLWTSFAITGTPVFNNVTLTPMQSASGPYMHLNKHLTLGEDILEELTSELRDDSNGSLDRPNVSF